MSIKNIKYNNNLHSDTEFAHKNGVKMELVYSSYMAGRPAHTRGLQDKRTVY
jgi:hypothetical protein